MAVNDFANESNDKSSNENNTSPNNGTKYRSFFERGASWTLAETNVLLALWGQDEVQRQLAISKRNRHVWEKIAEKIKSLGYDRTAGQVRTRIFNMLAEYRRILKNPTSERKKKCIFFNALQSIFKAKNLKSLNCDDFDRFPYFDPLDFSNGYNGSEDVEMNGDEKNNSEDEEGNDRNEILSWALSTINTMNNHDDCDEEISNHDSLGANKRCRFDDSNDDAIPFVRASLTGPLSPSSLENSTSSAAILIDRMFAHLTKETEVMREWVNLERERLAQEMARRKEEKEREERREKSFLDVLTKIQEQVFSVLSKPTSCRHTPSEE